MKVYGTASGRRSMTDIREYETLQLIDRAPHYNSIFAILEDPTITPILRALVETSPRALRDVEKDFAVDSTGFSTRNYVQWFDMKYGKMRSESGWIKGLSRWLGADPLIPFKSNSRPSNDPLWARLHKEIRGRTRRVL